MLEQFKEETKASGIFDYRRQTQTKDWFHQMIKDHLIDSFYREENRKVQIAKLEEDILCGRLTVSQGLAELFE